MESPDSICFCIFCPSPHQIILVLLLLPPGTQALRLRGLPRVKSILTLAGRFLSQELPPQGVRSIWVPTVSYVMGWPFFWVKQRIGQTIPLLSLFAKFLKHDQLLTQIKLILCLRHNFSGRFRAKTLKIKGKVLSTKWTILWWTLAPVTGFSCELSLDGAKGQNALAANAIFPVTHANRIGYKQW